MDDLRTFDELGILKAEAIERIRTFERVKPAIQDRTNRHGEADNMRI